MKTSFWLLATGILLLLVSPPPAPAEDANQLYEFEFKDPKDKGWFDTLQEKYMYFRVKDGYHMFDALSGKPMWAHKKLPDFDGSYTSIIGEEYLLYSTKEGAARLDMVSGKVDWSMALDNVKFKDVNDSWWTDYGRLFQIKKS